MSSLVTPPPQSVTRHFSPPLPDSSGQAVSTHFDSSHAIELSLETDLDSMGQYGSQWLVIARGQVCVFEDQGGTALLISAVDLTDIQSAVTEPHVGLGLLVVTTKDAKRIELMRFTPGLTKKFGGAARIIEALSRGEEAPIGALDDTSERKCSTCGLPLPDDTQVCPFCIDRGSTLRRLAGYSKRYKAKVALVVVLSFVGTGLSLVAPLLTTKVLTDQILLPHKNGVLMPPQHENWIGGIVLLSIMLAIGGLIVSIWRGRVSAWLSNHIVFELRSEVWDKLQTLSVAYYDKRQVGSLQTRVTQDVNELQQFLTDGVQVFFVNVLTILGIIVVMARINPLLTFIAILPFPFTVAMTRYLFKGLWGRMHRMFYIRSSLGGMVNSALSGVRVVKAFAQEKREKTRFRSKSEDLFRAQLNYEQTWASAFPIVALLATSGTFLIYYFGGIGVFHHMSHGIGGISLGTLQLFVVYMSTLMGPVFQMSRLPDSVSRSTAAAERVFEVLDAQVDVDSETDAVAMPNIEGKVELRDVKFSYDKSADVLKNISLIVRPGEMIGLVGHSGAGKSTMINLLMRFYDVTGGAILIDGVDIRHIRFDDLRQQVGVVLQEPFLFPGSVRENISYARADAAFEEVIVAAKRANAHDFILRLTDGYDTYVGERGARLSGGERQRISIARAILHNPRILILDEATASVDTETEKQIQDAIQYLVKGRTTFAIAHRLSTLRNADRLVVMERGTIVEVGTHEELLAMPEGVYKHLVELQQSVNKIRDESILVEG